MFLKKSSLYNTLNIWFELIIGAFFVYHDHRCFTISENMRGRIKRIEAHRWVNIHARKDSCSRGVAHLAHTVASVSLHPEL